MFLTESLQKKRYGWSASSKMPGRYEHMMNSDVEEAIFKHYGMSSSKAADLVNKPRICKICELPNSYDAKMCSKCGKPLDLATSIELDEKNQKQITTQNEKIETLENSLKSLQNMINSRDREWEQAMISYLEEFEKKLQNPQFAKKLREEANLEMENGNFN
jgi:ribosomal protein L40E